MQCWRQYVHATRRCNGILSWRKKHQQRSSAINYLHQLIHIWPPPSMKLVSHLHPRMHFSHLKKYFTLILFVSMQKKFIRIVIPKQKLMVMLTDWFCSFLFKCLITTKTKLNNVIKSPTWGRSTNGSYRTARLVEGSFPTPEVWGSNPVIGKFLTSQLHWLDESEEEGARNGPIKN